MTFTGLAAGKKSKAKDKDEKDKDKDKKQAGKQMKLQFGARSGSVKATEDSQMTVAESQETEMTVTSTQLTQIEELSQIPAEVDDPIIDDDHQVSACPADISRMCS